ncbi:MAG: hypothetical protein AB8I08_25240 [Sandaracinaceae bacterium]
MDRSSTLPDAPSDSPATPLKERLRTAVLRRRRLLAALGVCLLGLVGWRATWSSARAATREEALSQVCAREGLRVDPDTVLWVDEDEGPLRMQGALFLGRRAGELDDLHYAEIRPGSEGQVLDMAWLSNLSRTGSAEETRLTRVDDHTAVYAARVGERYDAIVVLDLLGEPASLTEGFSFRERQLTAISNVQRTGRAAGFGVRRYQLTAPSARVGFESEAGALTVTLDDVRLTFDPVSGPLAEGEELAELQPQTHGRPDTVPWIVNSVRDLSFVGPEPIEWLENRVFAVRDVFQRAYHAVAGPPDTAAEVAEDLAIPDSVTEERIAMLTVTDPELGWPPPPLEPILTSTSVEGEGRWIPVVDDPFVNAYPNAPPAFFQTFLRADDDRAFLKTYITIWDPRQVQMRIQSGVREPESATGQLGSGMVPREPDTLRHLVGAFNGGFQALHGEFGCMAEDRVYIPPKPWAATVAVFDDGRVGMGSWPEPSWTGRSFDEERANQQIPEEMVDMRQNLTSVVEDGQFNPWGRWYWGAAPRGAAEQTLTTRSAICLTDAGFLAYFYAQGSRPEALGAAMIETGCVRSVHLDMNNPHAGFEFFRPIAPDEEVAALAERPTRDLEYEGPFPRTEGWRLRARKANRSMRMPFPRYSDADARDFFYLTLRPVLPGPDLSGELSEGEGVFSTEGLPHAGWPHALARAHLGVEEDSRTWIVRIDPRRAVPEPLRHESHRRPLALLSAVRAAPRGELAVVAEPRDVGFRFVLREPVEGDRVIVSGLPLSGMPDAGAALGLDADGFLLYAENMGDAVPLASRLRAAGVTEAIVLGEDSRLAFQVEESLASVDGYARGGLDRDRALAFFAEERPRTEVMFPDNEPRPYRVWAFMQDRRVRYFPNRDPEERPRFLRPGDAE